MFLLRLATATLGFQAAAAGPGEIATSCGYVAFTIQIAPVAVFLGKAAGFMQSHDVPIFTETCDEFDGIFSGMDNRQSQPVGGGRGYFRGTGIRMPACMQIMPVAEDVGRITGAH